MHWLLLNRQKRNFIILVNGDGIRFTFIFMLKVDLK